MKFLVVLLAFLPGILHPFYVSVTEVRYNPAAGTMEMAQRVFKDDLEGAMGKVMNEKVSFSRNTDALSAALKVYLQSHVKVKVNGKATPVEFLGYEVEEDVVWLYMESKSPHKPAHYYMQNRVLMDFIPAQQNIVNVFLDKKPKSLLLTNDKDAGEIQF
jgi:hypothetical protein